MGHRVFVPGHRVAGGLELGAHGLAVRRRDAAAERRHRPVRRNDGRRGQRSRAAQQEEEVQYVLQDLQLGAPPTLDKPVSRTSYMVSGQV